MAGPPTAKSEGHHGDGDDTEVALTIAAWNKAVLPAEMQRDFDQKVLRALGPVGSSADGREVITYTMNLIAERRKTYYPDLRNRRL